MLSLDWCNFNSCTEWIRACRRGFCSIGNQLHPFYEHLCYIILGNNKYSTLNNFIVCLVFLVFPYMIICDYFLSEWQWMAIIRSVVCGILQQSQLTSGTSTSLRFFHASTFYFNNNSLRRLKEKMACKHTCISMLCPHILIFRLYKLKMILWDVFYIYSRSNDLFGFVRWLFISMLYIYKRCS